MVVYRRPDVTVDRVKGLLIECYTRGYRASRGDLSAVCRGYMALHWELQQLKDRLAQIEELARQIPRNITIDDYGNPK